MVINSIVAQAYQQDSQLSANAGEQAQPVLAKIAKAPEATLQFKDSDAYDEQLTELHSGRYVVGGLAAIFLGFGLGHAIQGRWLDSGWIFTASQFGAMAIGMWSSSQDSPSWDYSPSSVPPDPMSSYKPSNKTNYYEWLSKLSLMAYLASKIAEVIHVWRVDPRKYDIVEQPKPSHATYSLLPHFNASGFTGLQFAVALPVR